DLAGARLALMPELPELDVLAENLAAELEGVRVRAARALSPAALKTFDPPPDALAGQVIARVGRRAKYVWLQAGGLYLVVHLSLGGRIVLGTRPAPRRGGLFALELDDGRVLAVTEAGTQRRAAVWLVRDLDALAKLGELGLEPTADAVTVERRAELLARGGHTLKGMLTDQRLIAGVGNAWSDEVLHRARLSPFARPDRLPPPGGRGVRAGPGGGRARGGG